jgi:hypothetical protein
VLFPQEGFLRGVQNYEEDLGVMRRFVESSELHSALARQNTRQHEVTFLPGHFTLPLRGFEDAPLALLRTASKHATK